MQSTNGARSDDSKVFKSMILELMLSKKGNVLDPLLSITDSKALRGFNHPDFARLLLPLKWKDEMEEEGFL